MKPYIEWTKEELVAEKARLEQEFAEVKAKGLNLNISRGKPAAAQLDLTEGMLTVLSKMKTPSQKMEPTAGTTAY